MISWGKTDFSDTVEKRKQGVYHSVSQTKYDKMQIKTRDYMPKVNTKLANGNLNFVSGPFSHLNQKRNFTRLTQFTELKLMTLSRFRKLQEGC